MGLHAAAIVGLAATGNQLHRHGLLVAATPPAATSIWALTRLDQAEPATAATSWVGGLDLEFAFRVGDLALLMTILVSGIGTLIFIYAFGYFRPGAVGVHLFTINLLAFSTSMLGLVWSESVWTLFVFWELTSITSFMLVGHKNSDPAVRLAARRALLITAAGGLVLLAGLLVLVDQTGTGRLSEMPPITGTAATLAAVLVLVAAATKSAQVPFHVWLPGAMAAPTPVSAYLHSATMVKAGVLLVALAGPILGPAEGWRTLGLVFGLASLLWGAFGALRHDDAKLVLAWGTISQLGLMIALLSIGEGKATFAAISMVLAHAVFKAPLFMVVGEIDVRTGTRSLSELSGLWRSMPVAFVVAALSAASMAGVPPLLGFAAKEAAVEAALTVEGRDGWLILALVALGSTFTVAYTVRFLIGVFGPGQRAVDPGQTEADGTATEPVAVPVPSPASAALRWPQAVLAACSVLGFVFIGAANDLVIPAATALDDKASVYELHRWPGLTTGLAISVGIVAVGAGLGWLAARTQLTAPAPVGANSADRMTDQVVVLARRLTGRIQHGSLPVYVATMSATAAVVTIPFAWSIDFDALYWWDRPIQGVLALLVIGACAVAAPLRTRLAAAIGLGAVGLAVTGLFVVNGAPDLVLTQLLVETVIVVGFVVGLGHLALRFPRTGQQWRVVRLVVSAAASLGVAVALAGAASAPVGEPPIRELTEQAAETGGGNNVVNVILTDARGLDTLGEVVVLAVVAVGVLALATTRRPTAEETENQQASHSDTIGTSR